MTAPTRLPVFLVGLALGAVLGVVLCSRYMALTEPDVAHYREVRDYTKSAFVRDVSDEQMLSWALRGLASGLDDYSQYYDLAESAALARETSGRYFGLGIVLKPPTREGRILFPLSGSPAMAAGVRVGDRIVKIEQRPFEEIDEAEFRALISGNVPHDVELVLEGLDRTQRTLTVRTAEVIEPSVRHERMLDPERKVGYVAVTTFSRETPGEFAAAIERMRGDGLRSLIIDLRQNTGGVLHAAVEMARMFVTEGLIVSTEGRGEPVRYTADKNAAICAGMPLVVLVDESTASASEVFAAAVREHEVATLIGSSTYGKGLVQTLHRFGDPGPVMKVSTSYYFTPSHTNLEHSADTSKPRGLQADVRVTMTAEERVALRDRLARASPPRECRAAIAAWENTEGATLVEPIPLDAQLKSALEYLTSDTPEPKRAPSSS
ncbi:MAG: hypothetical protein JNL28_12235 [Planctomycetes bacterium]|nr:hypothetical protein [Planctomycetota bacterium]